MTIEPPKYVVPVRELNTKVQRAAAKELYTNTIQLAYHTKRELIAAIRTGDAPADSFKQVRILEENIKLLEAYIKQENL
jgi:hypothetical protein